MGRGNTDTLTRQWLMLQYLPRAPVAITAGELAARLDGAGFTISKRSVERDLITLSSQFPIVADERSKPYGWSWQRDAPTFSIPGMSPLQAAILLTAHAHLSEVLPAHQQRELRPLMQQAARTLAARTVGKQPTWPERVAVVSASQPLAAPTVVDDVLVAVHEALFCGRQIRLTYRARDAIRPQSYQVHPLGLVVRRPVTYLVCRIKEYDDVRSLAMHRIAQAEVLNTRAVAPKEFRIDDAVAQVAAGFDRGDPIRLELAMDEAAARHLWDTPLSRDQAIRPADEPGWVTVTATVQDTAQLRWWLLGFGNQVEIRKPLPLRRAVEADLAKALGRYQGGVPK